MFDPDRTLAIQIAKALDVLDDEEAEALLDNPLAPLPPAVVDLLITIAVNKTQPDPQVLLPGLEGIQRRTGDRNPSVPGAARYV